MAQEYPKMLYKDGGTITVKDKDAEKDAAKNGYLNASDHFAKTGVQASAPSSVFDTAVVGGSAAQTSSIGIGIDTTKKWEDMSATEVKQLADFNGIKVEGDTAGDLAASVKQEGFAGGVVAADTSVEEEAAEAAVTDDYDAMTLPQLKKAAKAKGLGTDDVNQLSADELRAELRK